MNKIEQLKVENTIIHGDSANILYDLPKKSVVPEQLVIDHILSWSNENDVVLDPFMGSGTTALACIKTNRKYIGIELNKDYVELSKKLINGLVI